MGKDFWLFFAGETISAFGSSFTAFAIPLLVYRLTGSALALGATAALGSVPFVLFGLHIGAWTDRLDRRHLMVGADLISAVAVVSLPIAAVAGVVSLPWVLAVILIEATAAVAVSTARFGAVPSLVAQADLVGANGRIQASFAAANILGPLAAGALLVVAPLETLLVVDAASFVVAALAVALVRRALTVSRSAGTSVGSEIAVGIRFVLGHPVLRNIALMMALVNLVRAPTGAQLVLLAKERYAASDAQVSVLFTAAGVGVFLLALAAAPIRARSTYAVAGLGSLMLSGGCYVALAFAPTYALAVACWGLSSGLGALFNITTGSLRQTLVPKDLLGRAFSVAFVLTVWTSPIGSLLGGIALERTDNVQLVYAGAGMLTILVPLLFWMLTSLRDADHVTS